MEKKIILSGKTKNENFSGVLDATLTVHNESIFDKMEKDLIRLIGEGSTGNFTVKRTKFLTHINITD